MHISILILVIFSAIRFMYKLIFKGLHISVFSYYTIFVKILLFIGYPFFYKEWMGVKQMTNKYSKIIFYIHLAIKIK